jgi:hypothetical protein
MTLYSTEHKIALSTAVSHTYPAASSVRRSNTHFTLLVPFGSYRFCFMWPHTCSSNALRSGDVGSQICETQRPITEQVIKIMCHMSIDIWRQIFTLCVRSAVVRRISSKVRDTSFFKNMAQISPVNISSNITGQYGVFQPLDTTCL